MGMMGMGGRGGFSGVQGHFNPAFMQNGMQGGGHSILSNKYGLAADRVVRARPSSIPAPPAAMPSPA